MAKIPILAKSSKQADSGNNDDGGAQHKKEEEEEKNEPNGPQDNNGVDNADDLLNEVRSCVTTGKHRRKQNSSLQSKALKQLAAHGDFTLNGPPANYTRSGDVGLSNPVIDIDSSEEEKSIAAANKVKQEQPKKGKGSKQHRRRNQLLLQRRSQQKHQSPNDRNFCTSFSYVLLNFFNFNKNKHFIIIFT
jgi:hypothetical protein